jgi:hypothetical protein
VVEGWTPARRRLGRQERRHLLPARFRQRGSPRLDFIQTEKN